MPASPYWEQFASAFIFLSLAVPFAVVFIGYVRDRFSLVSTVGALIVALLAPILGFASWHRWESLIGLFLPLAMVGVAAYMVFRSRWLQLPKPVAAGQGALSSMATFALSVVTVHLTHGPHWPWSLRLPLAGAVAATIVGLAGWAWRRLGETWGDPPVTQGEGERKASTTEERRMVLQMVADGKVSAEDAEQLLKAVGEDGRPGDELPVGGGERASIAGAIAVIVGFMLPWAYVSVRGPLPFAPPPGVGATTWSSSSGALHNAYQAGHHVGVLGYLILSLGLLPALLACIPALDRHLRQGMLRFVVAATGCAFVMSLVARCPSGIGLWVCLVGFGIQIVSALRQSGIWQQAQVGKLG